MVEKQLPKLDKTAFSVVSLREPHTDRAYWHSKTPQERLAAVEVSRRMVYGYDRATSRLQRFLEVAELHGR